MALLEVQCIKKQQPDRVIIDNISFQQEALQKIAVTGESGAGKSTMLKIISGNLQPDAGLVLFKGQKVTGPDDKLLPGHKDIAYLSQHYELHNNYVVRDLLFFDVNMDLESALRLLRICRVSHLLDRKTNQLSGGEKQRISLCILLLKRPGLLLLDEPFSNLDPIHKNTLKSVLEDISSQLSITLLLTSHDPQDTLSLAYHILVMKEGSIVQEGTPQQIYYHPAGEYVAGMFGKYNLLHNAEAALFGIPAARVPMIVRPEDFQIDAAAGTGVKGIVKKTRFWGGFQEVEVATGASTVIVRLIRNHWHPGDTVYLSWSGDQHG